jgi:hypothetical protein
MMRTTSCKRRCVIQQLSLVYLSDILRLPQVAEASTLRCLADMGPLCLRCIDGMFELESTQEVRPMEKGFQFALQQSLLGKRRMLATAIMFQSKTSRGSGPLSLAPSATCLSMGRLPLMRIWTMKPSRAEPHLLMRCQ